MITRFSPSQLCLLSGKCTSFFIPDCSSKKHHCSMHSINLIKGVTPKIEQTCALLSVFIQSCSTMVGAYSCISSRQIRHSHTRCASCSSEMPVAAGHFPSFLGWEVSAQDCTSIQAAIGQDVIAPNSNYLQVCLAT